MKIKVGRIEREYKNWFLKEFGGWSTKFEPGMGGDTGVPDCAVLIFGGVVFLEMKVGQLEGGRLLVSEIRPSQISWARKFFDAGGEFCFFVVGVPVLRKKDWRTFLLPLYMERFLEEMRHGFSLGQIVEWKFKEQSEKVRNCFLQEWKQQQSRARDQEKLSKLRGDKSGNSGRGFST